MANQLEFIRSRYRLLAPVYPIFNLVFALPSRTRARAIDAMQLKAGAIVLEVGCGTGSNFSLLEKALGPTGRIIGVDSTNAMLARAEARCQSRGWHNVTLLAQDAAEMTIPTPVDCALFSVSYTVMPDPRLALAQAWKYLRANGCVVILDAKHSESGWAMLFRPFVNLVNWVTVLGNLDRRPWDDLKEFTSHIEVEDLTFGYYICRGMKLA